MNENNILESSTKITLVGDKVTIKETLNEKHVVKFWFYV